MLLCERHGGVDGGGHRHGGVEGAPHRHGGHGSRIHAAMRQGLDGVGWVATFSTRIIAVYFQFSRKIA